MEIDKKETSARKIMVYCYTLTYCLVEVGLLIAMLLKIIDPATFLGVTVGFASLAHGISDWYFKRQDRKVNGEVKPDQPKSVN